MKITQKPKLLIDTDPGHDDALALLMLLKSGRFDLQAVTTVAGNSTIENVTRNTQAILDLVNSKVPVFSGKRHPLKRKLVQAVVHGESALDGLDTTKTKFALTGDAPERIVEIVRASPGEVTLLAIGPLSNIARAFMLDPELPKLIPEIIIMGGAIRVPGNKNRVAEFNFFVDPDAADIVLRADVVKTLVTLDICGTVVLKCSDFEAIADRATREALLPLMEHFQQGILADEKIPGILPYDALAAYVLLNRQAFTFEPLDVVVETEGQHTFGMSVAELRKYAVPEPNVQVATSLDRDVFRKDFFTLLSGT